MQIHRLQRSSLFCMLDRLLLSNIWHKAITLGYPQFYSRSWTKYNRKNSGTFVHIVSAAIVPLSGTRTFYCKLRVSVRNFTTTFMMNMLAMQANDMSFYGYNSFGIFAFILPWTENFLKTGKGKIKPDFNWFDNK